MTLANHLLRTVGGEEKLYVDDVFSTWLYTGNGSTQTINNGIDLAGKGGMVWIKERTALGTGTHLLYYTTQGVSKCLRTQGTNPQIPQTAPNFGLSAFNSVGFSLADDGSENTNRNGSNYASWTFRNADKFYNHAVVTKSAGSNATVSFANLGTLGMVRVKRTDSNGSWYIWHRSLSAGQLLIGETTAAAATLGHITVSGTTVTLVNGVIADGTYLVEAFAHDDSADGIIQCGIVTDDGNGTGVLANLGWEPQYVLIKRTDAGAENWGIADAMRGLSISSNSQMLYANTSAAEALNDFGYISASGWRSPIGRFAGQKFIYLAIRRPNKPPTTGTQVYNAIARTGTGAAATVTGVGFAPDLLIGMGRNPGGIGNNLVDRLRGTPLLGIHTTATESAASEFTSWNMDGASLAASASGHFNEAGWAYINHFFRRAPSVHEQICYTGTGANKTEAHNLGKAPELWLAKRRNAAGSWVFGSSLLNANEKIVMPSPNGRMTDATAWNSTYPTVSNISLGTLTDVNASGGTYVTYLWSTLAGVSKVFTYTGNGSSQTIDCGFSTGARFVLIIRATASTAQDIFIWDTARGIAAGNDPRLSLNTTAAEVTTLDTIDPASSGFVVNQDSSNVNVNGAVYIGLAYA